WRPRVSCLLIKNQIRSLQMNWIFQFFGRGLVWIRNTLRIRLQVNGDFASAGYVAGLLVVVERLAIDPVETRRIAAVNRNHHVVQLGPATRFKLDRLTGLQFEPRSSLLRP